MSHTAGGVAVGSWFRRLISLFRGGSRETGGHVIGTDDEVLSLRRDLQSLRLELEERDRELRILREELQRTRTREEERARGVMESRLESLLTDIATPASHLFTQIYLFEKKQKTVEVRDVVSVSRRMLRALMDHGLEVQGEPGREELYDPGRHEPIAHEVISSGERVVVRFPGFAYKGRVIRKAGVQRLG